MNKADRRRNVRNLVHAMREELVENTRKLVQIDTINPPGNNYRECSAFIETLMHDAHMDTRIVEVPEDRLQELAPQSQGMKRYNVLGTQPGGDPAGKILHYSGHYDVVPAGKYWSEDPFAARIAENGKIYGLGIGDMKAGITSMIAASKVVQALGVRLKGTATFSFTPDEETGGQAGVGYLVEQGLVPATWCVISEPAMRDLIKIGHRGVLWLRLTVIGKTAHGAMAFNGINAFENLARITVALKDLEQAIHHRTTDFPTQVEEEKHPLITLGGVLSGGLNKVNMVPDKCMVSIDRRVLPEEKLDDVYAEIVSCIEAVKAKHPSIEYTLEKELEVVGTAIQEDEQLVTALQDCHQEVFGQRPKLVISPGYNDLRYFVDRMKVPCVTYGPGILSMAHKPDEYILINDLLSTTEVFANLMCDLLEAE